MYFSWRYNNTPWAWDLCMIYPSHLNLSLPRCYLYSPSTNWSLFYFQLLVDTTPHILPYVCCNHSCHNTHGPPIPKRSPLATVSLLVLAPCALYHHLHVRSFCPLLLVFLLSRPVSTLHRITSISPSNFLLSCLSCTLRGGHLSYSISKLMRAETHPLLSRRWH